MLYGVDPCSGHIPSCLDCSYLSIGLGCRSQLFPSIDSPSSGRCLHFLSVVHRVQCCVGAEGDFGTIHEYIRASFEIRDSAH